MKERVYLNGKEQKDWTPELVRRWRDAGCAVIVVDTAGVPAELAATQYQPVRGAERGPRFASATEACLWIISQPQSGWEWEAV